MPEEMREKKTTKNRYILFCRAHNFRPSLVTIVLILILALLSGTVFWSVRTVSTVRSKTTDLGLKSIGELATQVGYYTNVQVIENSREVLGIVVPFTQSSYIYSYNGIVKVGFDFEAIQVISDDAGRTITVRLPEPMVISNDIDEDSLEVYNETKNIFTPLKLSQVSASQSAMKEEALNTAIENGIYESARANAETLIRSFLAGSLDLKDYTIVFEAAAPKEGVQ